MAKLILISGKRFSGKDTVAHILYEQLRRHQKQVSLASTALLLKERFCYENDLDLQRFLNDREYKEEHREKFTEFVLSTLPEENLRLFLKSIGANVTSDDFVIVSDLRTMYDLKSIQGNFHDTLTIRVVADDKARATRGYKESRYDASSFETELDDEVFDITIENNTSLKDLEDRLLILVNTLISK